MAIVVIGTTFVDVKGFPSNVYIPAGRNAGNVEFVHGGVGRNVAEDIANIELKPVYVSMTDETAIGHEVLVRLEEHNVNTDYIAVSPDGLGMWLAVFNEKGDVVASISKRPGMEPLTELIENKSDEIFEKCDSIVIELDLEGNLVDKVFAAAAKYNKNVYALVSNITIASERRDYISKTSCFICNAQEAEILFLSDFSGLGHEEMLEKLKLNMHNAGIKTMVVTLGGDGCIYAEEGGESGYLPARKVNVRDTTGAGDAFCAGVSAALTYGKRLSEAVETGTRLASATVSSRESVCPHFQPSEFGINI